MEKILVEFTNQEIRSIVSIALQEDIGTGDLTTDAVINEDFPAYSVIVTRENGVVAGLEFAKEAFRILDPLCSFEDMKTDGDKIKKGDVLIGIRGKIKAILKGERVALNYLQRMSGIASVTAEFVELTSGKTKILDTRKTYPGMRKIEKYSVLKGGGENHRSGLYDQVIIKDNHIAACGSDLSKAIERVKNLYPMKFVEVEVVGFEQIPIALKAGVNRIMLDNMELGDIEKAVKIIDGKCEIEVSGNMDENKIAAVSALGVDYISVGKLTHSYKSLDIALDIVKKGAKNG
ncbi:carboxylating nicotinate-nucleotide diphosphorylase [candidate division WOR-3 bacterium]|nr:carboxylating nicotinate-nucleotide diphosphorylase [candidate division WOR-3 bacterium]